MIQDWSWERVRIGKREFPSGERTYIMGILNVTPDSFSDGGEYDNMDRILRRVEKMAAEGADIVDIGGESTRPGHRKVEEEVELARIIPVIEAVKERFDVPVSVDTYKSVVAEAALQAGADLLNDIWGFRYDERCAEVAAKYGAAVCLTHNRDRAAYDDFGKDVISDLKKSLSIAGKYGIPDEKIILDPGIGFGKTQEQNLFLLNHLEDIAALGYPVLLGASRKSVIGLTLNLPVEQREEGTIAVNIIGRMKGCEYVRVHDVEKNVRACKMADAILHARKWG